MESHDSYYLNDIFDDNNNDGDDDGWWLNIYILIIGNIHLRLFPSNFIEHRGIGLK